MPYTTPTTITAAELITVQKLNEQWIDNIAFLANPPACRVYRSTNQSINSASQTAITFDSERYDTASMHSTSSQTDRITFATAGIYLVTGHVEFASATDYTSVSLLIRLNGTTNIAYHNVTNTTGITVGIGVSIATAYKFAANDWVTLDAFQVNAAAAARNVSALGNYSPEFSATWIGLG